MRLAHSLLILSLLFVSSASAYDFVSSDTDDWFRYTSPSGDEVIAQISLQEGSWNMWTDFAGFGPSWVWTSPQQDSQVYFWNFDTGAYAFLGDVSRSGSQNLDMPPCNQGRVQIAVGTSTVSTPAGDFQNVTRVTLETSCADGGVTSMVFAPGIGVVQYSVMTIAGEVTYTLDTAMVQGVSFPQGGQTTPTVNGLRAPAEHERMETILWGTADTYIVRDTYRDAFTGLDSAPVGVQVVVSSQSVASQLRYEMSQDNVPMGNVDVLIAPLNSVWMRDYGPIILKRPNGERVVADLDYYPGRPRDDEFPRAYANFRGWDVLRVDGMGYEGGNFATDGQGLGACSLGVQWFNPFLSVPEIEERFARMGCDRVEFFQPLIDEGTTHVDMFMRVMSDTRALVSSYPQSHRQATVVNAAARQFENLGYQVVRVPADYRYDEFGTYSNSVLANDTALVPQYTNAAKNQAALDAYENLGYRAVGVDSRLIIRYLGATHCVSMQIPAGN